MSKIALDKGIEKLLNLEKIEFVIKYDVLYVVVGRVPTGDPVGNFYKVICKKPDGSNEQGVHEKIQYLEYKIRNSDKKEFNSRELKFQKW